MKKRGLDKFEKGVTNVGGFHKIRGQKPSANYGIIYGNL